MKMVYVKKTLFVQVLIRKGAHKRKQYCSTLEQRYCKVNSTEIAKRYLNL